ncbi:MAG: site-specific integrase [Campylobacteraceae bacterium]|jgi:integrase|nr:site-specific integrase [Campylobacteraceae bacterium]
MKRSEIDLDEKMWKIPTEKMKMKLPHWIPLSKQVIELIKTIKTYTYGGKYLFPSPMTTLKPISENTILHALRRMDYTRDEIVAHSFRGIASTLLNENIRIHHIHSDVIEFQLSHTEKNKSKAAYNHAEYLDDRIFLMQWWSDYLDKIKG